jgi:long-chain acyl-CoA synthetase
MTTTVDAPGDAPVAAAPDWCGGDSDQPVFACLDMAVARFGDRPCIDFLGRRYSYAEIGALTDRAAEGFRRLGVGPGVRVGLCLPNTPYAVICYYAVLKAGGTVVNYNPLYVERELAALVEVSGTEIMVTLDLRVLYPKVAALLDETRLSRVVVCPMRGALPWFKGLLFALFRRKDLVTPPDDERHIPFARLVDNDGLGEPPAIAPRDDVAVLQFTGGTTGTPKAAMLTHANLMANTWQVRCWVAGIEEVRERLMGVLPLSHVFGMTLVMNLGISSGSELVLVPRFDVDELLQTLYRRRVTIMMGVPTIFTAINASAALDEYDLSSLKYCVSGGAPLPESVKRRFDEQTGGRLVEGYGLTECSPVVAVNPFDGRDKTESVGPPLPDTVIEIRDPEGARNPLPQGETGEVCVIGPQVMAGYWERPEETAATIIDGRLHTGDVGYLDEDGYLFLVDRIKDLILCSGYNVYPSAVEDAIGMHDAVYATAVIGVPDDYRGETPKAFVQLQDGLDLTENDLKAFLKDKLSPIEMPEFIEFRDALPTTPVGKISKKALIAEEAAKRDGAPC